jgi:hypothetical protein
MTFTDLDEWAAWNAAVLSGAIDPPEFEPDDAEAQLLAEMFAEAAEEYRLADR